MAKNHTSSITTRLEKLLAFVVKNNNQPKQFFICLQSSFTVFRPSFPLGPSAKTRKDLNKRMLQKKPASNFIAVGMEEAVEEQSEETGVEKKCSKTKMHIFTYKPRFQALDT